MRFLVPQARRNPYVQCTQRRLTIQINKVKIKEPYGIRPYDSLFKIYASDLANLFLILQLAVYKALSNKSFVCTLSSLAILSLAFSR